MIKRDRLLKPPVPPPLPPQKLNGPLFSTWPSGILTYLSLMLRTALQLSTYGTHTSWLSLRSLIKSDGS